MRFHVLMLAVAFMCGATIALAGEYRGVEAQALFARTGLSIRDSSVDAAQPMPSVIYYLKNSPGHSYFAIGVYLNEGRAREVLQNYRNIAAISPVDPPPPPGGAFADELEWATDDDDPHGPSALATFRRGNVVVTLRRHGPIAETAALARQIDQLIQNDRQIAPLRAPDDHPPEIVSAGFPAALVSGVPTTITPEFRGLGERAKLRVVVAGGGEHLGVSNRIVPTEGISYSYAIERPPGGMSRAVPKTDDGRFVVTAKGDAGPAKVTITAFGEMNTIAQKTVEVQVVAPPGE